MKLNIALSTLLLSAGMTIGAQAQTALLGVSASSADMFVLDTADGYNHINTINVVGSMGETIDYYTGMAVSSTGTVYVVANVSSSRSLMQVDPFTGIATMIAPLGDKFVSIALQDDNTMFATTGGGASVPNALYQINVTTGATTFLRNLPDASGGNTLAYCPDDDQLYLWTSNGSLYQIELTAPYNHTTIPRTGYVSGSAALSATYVGDGDFLVYDGGSASTLFTIDTTGAGTLITATLAYYRGIAFYPYAAYPFTGIAASQTSFCPGDSALLTAPAGSVSYQWSLDGTPINGATNQTYVAYAEGSYNCWVEFPVWGIDTVDTAAVISHYTVPVVALNAGSSTMFCQGGDVTLTGSSGGSSQWYLDGMPIIGANSNSYTATMSGLYNMVKTNASGCADSAALGVSVTVYPLPLVDLVLAQDTACADAVSFALSGGSPMGGMYSGAAVVSGSDFDPSMAVVGNNEVVYTFTDANNCTASDTAMITVSVCAGVQDLAAGATTLLLYPNPANDYVTLIAPAQEAIQQVWAQTLTGQSFELPVQQQKQQVTFAVNHLPQGIYLLRVITTSGDMMHARLVVSAR